MDPPSIARGVAELAADVRIHYRVAGDGPATVILIHGYPQTGHQWRHVVGPLAGAGYRVVVPDYRGAGHSSRPPAGYDKRTMAGDVRSLVRDHLEIEGPLAVVGHDIGSMVAFAFALRYPDEVARLVLGEAPLPGTDAYDGLLAETKLANNPLWHFAFHNAPGNLAETLTFGRERAYLDQFYDRLAFDPAAIGPDDRARYAEAFASVGAMRAGFELYRAFDRDAEDNRSALKAGGRLRMPVLALAGGRSVLTPTAGPMMEEIAAKATLRSIPAAGHWIAEENPEDVARGLVAFLAEGRS